MTVLPIVSRELRVASQRRGTYRTRLGAAVLALLFFCYLYLFTNWGDFDSNRLGLNILILLSSLAFVYSLLAGVIHTADCLSGERRQGTMGLLFLTRLRSHDVTAGKLAAHSLASLYSLTAVVPILGLSMLFGGVANHQFIHTALALFATLLLSLSVGMLTSSLFQEAKQSMTAAILILLLVTFACPLVENILRAKTSPLWQHTFLTAISPVILLTSSWSGINSSPFWPSFILILGVSTSAMIGATVMTARWQRGEEPTEAASLSAANVPTRRRRISAWVSRQTRRLPIPRIPFAIRHPFDRLVHRKPSGNRILWLLLGSCGLALTWLFFQKEQMYLVFGLYALLPLHIVLKILIAAEACRRIQDDRANGLLELLAITPEPVSVLPLAYTRTIRHYFAEPVSLLAVLNGLAIVGFYFNMIHARGGPNDSFLIPLLILGGGVALLFCDFYALIWMGLHYGLIYQRLNRSLFSALAILMTPSWLGILVIFAFGVGSIRQETAEWMITAWLLASLVYSLGLAQRSRQILRRSFHQQIQPSR